MRPGSIDYYIELRNGTMKTTRKIRIIHTLRRRIESPARCHCRLCGREVEMMTHSQAASFLDTDGTRLDDLIASGRVHAMVTVSGTVRVCQDSLIVREG